MGSAQDKECNFRVLEFEWEPSLSIMGGGSWVVEVKPRVLGKERETWIREAHG